MPGALCHLMMHRTRKHNTGFLVPRNPPGIPCTLSTRGTFRTSTSTVLALSNASTPAPRYASALGELAKRHNILEQINDDIQLLSRILQKQPKILKFLASPVIPADKKKDILKQIGDEKELHRYTVNLLCLLVDKRRMAILKEVLHEFDSVYLQLNDIQLVEITSAVELQAEEIERVKAKVRSWSEEKNLNLKVKNVVDESLIGGMVVKFGKNKSRTIDLSIKSQLKRLAAHLQKDPDLE